VEVPDALLAVLPAQVHGAAVQLAAEVDQPVGGLHLYAQLRHFVQDVAELPDQADRPRLQPLHGRRSFRVHDHVGPFDSPPGLLELLLQAISSSRSCRARVNSSISVARSALASRSENSRVGRGTSTGAPYRMSTRTGSASRATVLAMLRELRGEERDAYFRGIQPIWGGGLSEDRFQLFQRQLADAPEARERYRLLGWFVQGRMAAGMKAYDLRGACGGRPLRLLGVGAVFTPPELRRRGHAAAMLRAAMEAHAAAGATAAVLFSDIGVRYYERLGFHVLDSRECTVEAVDLPRPADGVRPALAGDEPMMTRLFAAGRNAGRRFALDRDGWTLRFQLRRLRELARARGMGEPEWGMVAEGHFGEGAAMVRLARDSVDVLDAAWSSDEARDRILGGLRDCLQRAGRSRVRLWPAGQLAGVFTAPERASAVAMIAPLIRGRRCPSGAHGPTWRCSITSEGWEQGPMRRPSPLARATSAGRLPAAGRSDRSTRTGA